MKLKTKRKTENEKDNPLSKDLHSPHFSTETLDATF